MDSSVGSRFYRAYRAKPSRRTYIPKADGRQRPFEVAAMEDKILQQALVTVLNQIYEGDSLGFSYGFRPRRSQHDALDALWMGITGNRVNWVRFQRLVNRWIPRPRIRHPYPNDRFYAKHPR